MAHEFIENLPVLRADLCEYSDAITPRIVTLIYTELDALVQLYNSFKEDSQSLSQSDIDIARQKLKELIPICNQFDVDYRKKLSLAQEFYGI